jgi:uncharacterized protein YmfQ (DUF2313 family)
MTRGQYVELLKNLLPRGLAWPRDTAAYFHKIFDAVAEEMVRFDERVSVDLVNEADPNTTLELLEDWERVTGIPDDCQGSVSETVALRRADILRKLTARGGQARQFFIALAATFGYTITIDEPRPFRVGHGRCGDRCYDVDWIHHWRVLSASVVSSEFRVGTGRCGDRLRVWRNDELECLFGEKKPAHTKVHFVYGS